MTYTDICLKFPDKATQEALLPLATETVAAAYALIDVIGFTTAYSATPVADAEGLPTGTLDTSAWLVNVRMLTTESLNSNLASYVISAPLFPKRVWSDI